MFPSAARTSCLPKIWPSMQQVPDSTRRPTSAVLSPLVVRPRKRSLDCSCLTVPAALLSSSDFLDDVLDVEL